MTRMRKRSKQQGSWYLPTQAMHYLGKILWIVWSSRKIGNWTIPVQIHPNLWNDKSFSKGAYPILLNDLFNWCCRVHHYTFFHVIYMFECNTRSNVTMLEVQDQTHGSRGNLWKDRKGRTVGWPYVILCVCVDSFLFSCHWINLHAALMYVQTMYKMYLKK